LRLLHNNPAHPWTVAALAAEVGVSRAALARRFTELVGEPPMAFLTGWRLALAADLLLEPDATVGAVARPVGYTSPFTFSTAFKRRYGVSPQAHRRAAASVRSCNFGPPDAAEGCTIGKGGSARRRAGPGGGVAEQRDLDRVEQRVPVHD